VILNILSAVAHIPETSSPVDFEQLGDYVTWWNTQIYIERKEYFTPDYILVHLHHRIATKWDLPH